MRSYPRFRSWGSAWKRGGGAAGAAGAPARGRGARVGAVGRFPGALGTGGGGRLASQAQRGKTRLSFTIVPDTATGVDPQYPKRPRTYGFIGAQLKPGVTRVRKPP